MEAYLEESVIKLRAKIVIYLIDRIFIERKTNLDFFSKVYLSVIIEVEKIAQEYVKKIEK